MAQIIVTTPGVLTAKDKAALRRAGVVPIEADDPATVRLIECEGPPLPSSEMLHAAVSAMNGDGWRCDARTAFVKALAASLAASSPNRETSNG